ELLLAGLLLEGDAFLNRLEGMWAFALWDAESRELFLARDRFGKKPLYYRGGETSFALASELRALLALCPDRTEDENLQSVADYFRFGFCMPGDTFYCGIHELLPGYSGRWRLGNLLVVNSYWQPEFSAYAGSLPEAYAELRRLFVSSVQRRMVADVEVGAFLSGGVDSSLVVAAMRRVYSGAIKTFTIGFADAGYDERAYARLVAKQYGTDHHEAVLDDFSCSELTRLLLDHVGQPFADPSLLPTAMVAAVASRHVKVVLSGDGSDEFFGGYQRYAGEVIAGWYDHLPSSLQRAFTFVVRRIPEPRVHH